MTVKISSDDFKSYMKRGKLLAKHETEDLSEFMRLATIEEEEYKSSVTQALAKTKEASTLADIYYYWGRCIKDLSRDKTGEEKLQYLLAEEDKYKTAISYCPNDSYVLYSWAINLRYQLEHVTGDDVTTVYQAACKKYRSALTSGYIEKYVLWGLGSLKLYMARKALIECNWEDAQKYIVKAEKSYQRLQNLRPDSDTLTAFSLCFNYSCIFSCKSKLEEHSGNLPQAKSWDTKCIEKLKECSKNTLYKEYLTQDLATLWYFQGYAKESWYQDIVKKSKPKKLSACW